MQPLPGNGVDLRSGQGFSHASVSRSAASALGDAELDLIDRY
jgi:hypothetical protein